MTRREVIGDAELWLGDCREVAPSAEAVLVTDPPYPNAAGHFVEDIEAARAILSAFAGREALVFWHELETPPLRLPLVAKHIWYRSNTNRPDNYEAIYHFHADGRKRPSRVLRHSVIAPGLTGIEATGHPTEKNVALMSGLLGLVEGGVVSDPFMGSGSCGVAAVSAGRRFVGVERNPLWYGHARRRIEAAQRQADMFVERPAPRPEQTTFALESAA